MLEGDSVVHAEVCGSNRAMSPNTTSPLVPPNKKIASEVAAMPKFHRADGMSPLPDSSCHDGDDSVGLIFHRSLSA